MLFRSGDTPAAHATLLMALAETLSPPRSVVLQGEAAPLAGWQSRLGGRYLLDALVLAVPAGAGPLPAMLDKGGAEPSPGGMVRAWLCQGMVCFPPTEDFDKLAAALFQSSQENP